MPSGVYSPRAPPPGVRAHFDVSLRFASRVNQDSAGFVTVESTMTPGPIVEETVILRM